MVETGDATDFMAQFSRSMETTLTGFVGPSEGSLPVAQPGRSQRLKPEKQQLQPCSMVQAAQTIAVLLPLDQGRKTTSRSTPLPSCSLDFHHMLLWPL